MWGRPILRKGAVFMKRNHLLCSVLLLCVLVFCAGLAFAAPETLDDAGKTVVSIEVKELPAKTEYFVKEKFDISGGVILVTYDDGSTAELSMTSPDLDVSKPNTSKTGSKNVGLKYRGKITSFKISVAAKGLTVTFHLNCDLEDIRQNVTKGSTAKKVTAPEREGYTFQGWYADEPCTVLYDFGTVIEEDRDVFALWTDNSAVYHTVSFSLNYYGSLQSEYPQIVKDGGNASIPSLTPEREGYAFEGWFADEQGETPFDASAAVTADAIVYARWARTKAGASTYTFEAEDVNLNEKSGPGYSGENAGPNMIVLNKDVQASNDRFVAYQCRYGNSLEFCLASDTEAEAVLTIRFAAEFSNMTLVPDIYEISVNGTPLQYQAIALTMADGSQQGLFEDCLIGTVTLRKGENLIQVKTINREELGGTLTATAPIIDCIRLETEAVVTWDGAYGLPMNNY